MTADISPAADDSFSEQTCFLIQDHAPCQPQIKWRQVGLSCSWRPMIALFCSEWDAIAPAQTSLSLDPSNWLGLSDLRV